MLTVQAGLQQLGREGVCRTDDMGCMGMERSSSAVRVEKTSPRASQRLHHDPSMGSEALPNDPLAQDGAAHHPVHWLRPWCGDSVGV